MPCSPAFSASLGRYGEQQTRMSGEGLSFGFHRTSLCFVLPRTFSPVSITSHTLTLFLVHLHFCITSSTLGQTCLRLCQITPGIPTSLDRSWPLYCFFECRTKYYNNWTTCLFPLILVSWQSSDLSWHKSEPETTAKSCSFEVTHPRVNCAKSSRRYKHLVDEED